MINVNCDIGERGVAHPTDDQIMQCINIANIAVGGHAGNIQSVNYYRNLAEKYHVKISVHLSYPDKENFGRTSLVISHKELEKSLDQQYELLSDIKTVKLHGALYNDCWTDKELASFIYGWLKTKGINEVIAPGSSELATLCKNSNTPDNIAVIAEVFAERNYQYVSSSKVLRLMPRTNKNASIEECDSAVNHVNEIIENKAVNAFVDESADRIFIPVISDTFCVHSDSLIALELIKKLKNI